MVWIFVTLHTFIQEQTLVKTLSSPQAGKLQTCNFPIRTRPRAVADSLVGVDLWPVSVRYTHRNRRVTPSCPAGCYFRRWSLKLYGNVTDLTSGSRCGKVFPQVEVWILREKTELYHKYPECMRGDETALSFVLFFAFRPKLLFFFLEDSEAKVQCVFAAQKYFSMALLFSVGSQNHKSLNSESILIKKNKKKKEIV